MRFFPKIVYSTLSGNVLPKKLKPAAKIDPVVPNTNANVVILCPLPVMIFYFINFKTFTRINIKIFAKTIHAPDGKLNIIDKLIPIIKFIKDITPENIINFKNPFAKFRAVTAGKIITLEINNVPSIRIPKTTTRAVKIEINI